MVNPGEVLVQVEAAEINPSDIASAEEHRAERSIRADVTISWGQRSHEFGEDDIRAAKTGHTRMARYRKQNYSRVGLRGHRPIRTKMALMSLAKYLFGVPLRNEKDSSYEQREKVGSSIAAAKYTARNREDCLNYTDLNENDNFLRYPTNKVIGIVDTPEQLKSAVRELNNLALAKIRSKGSAGKKALIALMSPASTTASLLVCTDSFKNLETWNL